MPKSETLVANPSLNKRVAPLTVLLGVVLVAFCGILVFVYIATKRANPVMLDQQGKPLGQSAAPAESRAR